MNITETISEVTTEYQELLESKSPLNHAIGFDTDASQWPWLFEFQKYCTQTALKVGRFALFEGCGLGKTRQAGTWAWEIVKETKEPVLILSPLGVVAQTIKELASIGIECFEYETGEVLRPAIYISNYDQLANIPTDRFIGVCLDESSILKNFTGATKKALIEAFAETHYKLCCTATPFPNDLNEVGNHSEFLNVLDAQDMRAKWFVRDEGMNNYRLKGHAHEDFYAWMRTWCLMFDNPADIGYPMEGYDMPEVEFQQIVIAAENRAKGKLFNEGHVNATSFHSEVRLTMTARLDAVAEIVNGSEEQFIIWIEQNAEGDYLRSIIPGAVEVRGSDPSAAKKKNLLGFAEGAFRVLITKGEIAGFGMNYQSSWNMIFANPSFSFETIWQCKCRQVRYGQMNKVNIWMVTTDTMENVIASYQRKETQFFESLRMINEGMNKKQYGLVRNYVYKEVRNERMWLMKGDTVIEQSRIPDNSVDLQVYSPPFSSLFTYSNYIHDLGNNASHADFFKQYAHVLREDYRTLKPGRLAVFHTKNLGVYKNSSGYTGMYDFTGEHRKAVEAAGFKLHCIITIWTDPVLEMQRTKTQRLLYKTLTSDSTFTGVGMPEFLYVFRKWEGDQETWEPVNHITKANFPLDKWQEWASPVYRENLLDYEKADLVQTILQMKAEIFRLKYDCNEGLPDSWYDDVWFDIKRTDVLNGKEGTAMGDEKHIAPLQLEVIRRVINFWSNPGETVKTSFGGIGSEPYVALMEGRNAIAIELKDSYFDVMVKNCNKALEIKKQTTLF